MMYRPAGKSVVPLIPYNCTKSPNAVMSLAEPYPPAALTAHATMDGVDVTEPVGVMDIDMVTVAVLLLVSVAVGV